MELKIYLMLIYIASQSFGLELGVPKFVRNFGMSSKGYHAFVGGGLYSCARHCGIQTGCKSFTYIPAELGCRFIEEDAGTDPWQYTESSGYIYGDRATILPNVPLMDLCSNHNCPEYTVCVGLSSGSTACIISACGPTPGVPVNVDISPTMGLVGFPRQLHCDSGYQGFRTVICSPNGNWSETENNCSAPGCGTPPSISNAVISNGNTTIGSTRIYECIPTSIPSGSGNITCQQNGTWSASSLVCVVPASDCGTPPSVSNAAISNGNTSIGAARSFECIPQTIGSGSGDIVCQQDGTWSTSSLVCVFDCGTPLSLPNTIISAGNTTQGSTRTYECIPQFTASGSGDITCLSDGTWTVASLMCISDCVVVTNMLNAFTTATVAPAGTTISYTCHVGFVQTAGTGNRLCNEQGSWEALDITCNPTNDCGNPPTISNATVSNGSTTIGSTRTYECVPASTASGFGEITCQPNKTWTLPSLVCIPDCVIEPLLGNAYTTATEAPANSIVLYICMPEYVQTAGSGYRVCGAQGEWTLFDITCTHYTQSGAPDKDG